MSVNGEAGGSPLRVGLPVVDMVTGLNAALGIMMALHERESSGHGQFVESTLYDSAVSLLHPHAANWFLNSKRPVLTGNAHPNIYPYDAFPSATVPIFMAVGNDRQFALMSKHLGTTWHEDERFTSAGGRSTNRADLRALMEAALARLRAIGAAGCVLLGDPAYYARFGFIADPRLQLPGAPPGYFQCLSFGAAIPTAEVRYDAAFDAG